jgi:hypothetical protein
VKLDVVLSQGGEADPVNILLAELEAEELLEAVEDEAGALGGGRAS